MKLGIFCNFGPGHIGGSEMVIDAIAKGLISDFGYEISVYASNYKKISTYNGMRTIPCHKGDALIAQINENDHILVYSDSFWGWDTIVENGFLPTVIPNGVDLEEFATDTVNFREKYNIQEKYIILNVSQFFYGKGQESLGKISKELRRKRDDFIFVQVSSHITYPYENNFLTRAKKAFGTEKCLFLRDIPREDVISAFKGSDVFCFTSGKEVAPLVILEARAAKLPWVSMEVGDVFSHHDGIMIRANDKSNKGYRIVSDSVVSQYARFINEILEKKLFREPHNYKGVQQRDWRNIVIEYDKVFKS